MGRVSLLTKDDKTVRTQITLTEELKELVEKNARSRNESLSEYIRKAALLRWSLESEESKDLKRISRRVIGSVRLKNHPEWQTKARLKKWVRTIRKEW